ncbi:MAG TPA: GAF domain-containing protein [Chryseosolibacter sp.]|nr:GAF domain-containing protein [Chryseosolibacter sp.]
MKFFIMETVATNVKEEKRLQALRKYKLLDTPPDGAFDRITALASKLFKVPIAIISLVDKDRIWFKSHHGLSINQIGRDPGLCASAILSNELYIVENAKDDPRTLANPLVAGDFGLRFYAAVPLQTDETYNLGTLCIIDKEPRKLTVEEQEILQQLGDLVMEEMNIRLALREASLNVKSISNDVLQHLRSLSGRLNDMSKSDLELYLKASTAFLENNQHRFDNLN